MGTNYYWIEDACPHCGRGEDVVHIGWSIPGWCFALRVYPPDINDLGDWLKRFTRENAVIKSEYGETIPNVEMIENIMKRSHATRPKGFDTYWLIQNQAEPGPNNLARHQIDGDHCIGHGSGTWDLMIGEFS